MERSSWVTFVVEYRGGCMLWIEMKPRRHMCLDGVGRDRHRLTASRGSMNLND